ncbi:dihydrodipicolinate reductase [Yoonia sp.]|uniref:dihydrodipicolinate reductase n=1 Tax=Yoonia sp. TaxID=2212373 RepID=UPI00391A68E1
MKTLALSLGLTLTAGAAFADYAPVTDEAAFMQLVEGRELRHRFYPIRLVVQNDGQVTGSAVGWDVAGTWSWQDGYFCRELVWGGDPIPFNCQLVEVNDDLIRFTVDQGAGQAAAFRLR